MLVFLQEVGFPNPIPNELVLLFSGYLGFTGMLKIPLVILAAVLGDWMGSSILFLSFFLFGKTIMEQKPFWLPVSKEKLHRLERKLQQKGFIIVLIGRVSPFIRGYVSVLMGLMTFPIKKYNLVLFVTAVFWSCSYVLTGFLMGPYWRLLSGYIIKI
jgi:membrane protein DedA with SNARE-associated domain